MASDDHSSRLMKHDIAFLHTAGQHVESFGKLVAELAPDLNVRHDVDESLLAEAQASGGIGPGLAARIQQAMLNAASSGASLVVCTCSTIGGVAERAGRDRNLTTQRIDRAMADAAVNLGARILIIATLGSAVNPARELIAHSAVASDKQIAIAETVVKDAWSYFEQAMPEAYNQKIAAAIMVGAEEADVIVLAQASMAGAIKLCQDVAVPVLTSPRLGVEAAIAALKHENSHLDDGTFAGNDHRSS